MKLRVLSLYALVVMTTSCGGSPVDVEDIFGVSGQTYCDEVNIVFEKALALHLTKNRTDAEEVYRAALEDVIYSSRFLSKEKKDDLYSRIFPNETSPKVEELETCQNLSEIHDYRSKHGVFEGVSSLSRFQPEESIEIFREFLSRFGPHLDVYSRYVRPLGEFETTYHYGLVFDFLEAYAFEETIDALKILDVSLNQNSAVKDRSITGIKIPSGAILMRSRAGTVVSMREFTNGTIDRGFAKLEKLLTASPFDQLEVRVTSLDEEGGEETITLQGIQPRQRRQPVIYSQKVLDDIYQIKILAFQPGLRDQIEGQLEEIQKEVGSGKEFSLILDLRFNPGGSLNEAINSLDLFVDSGTVATILERGGIQEIKVQESGEAFDGPLVILMNHGSASASEFLAQSLQSINRAVVVGERSFGKGIGQDILELGFSSLLGGRFRVTSLQFYDPTGYSPQIQGVEPDIAFSTLESLEKQSDYFSNCDSSQEACYLRMDDLLEDPYFSDRIINTDDAAQILSTTIPQTNDVRVSADTAAVKTAIKQTRENLYSQETVIDVALEYFSQRQPSAPIADPQFTRDEDGR